MKIEQEAIEIRKKNLKVVHKANLELIYCLKMMKIMTRAMHDGIADLRQQITASFWHQKLFRIEHVSNRQLPAPETRTR